MELHQSFGTDYRTVAACQLKMREILDRSHGRYHGSVMLTGVNYEGTGMNFGTLEYWVRLRVPMEQALRLYKVGTAYNFIYKAGDLPRSAYHFAYILIR